MNKTNNTNTIQIGQNCQIIYELTDFEAIIKEVTIDYQIKDDIHLPETIDNQPVYTLNLNNINLINYNKKYSEKENFPKVYLPDSLKVIDNGDFEKKKDYHRIISCFKKGTIPANLEYDYFAGFDGEINQKLKYSNSRFNINKKMVLEKEYYLDSRYQERYLGTIQEINFLNAYINGIKKYFNNGVITINDYTYSYYIVNDNQVWIYDINKNFESNILTIPNTFLIQDKEYPVVGLGINSFKLENISNLICGDNLLYLSPYFDLEKKGGYNLFLNSKINYLSNNQNVVNIFVPYENQEVVVRRWILEKDCHLYYANPNFNFLMENNAEYNAEKDCFIKPKVNLEDAFDFYPRKTYSFRLEYANCYLYDDNHHLYLVREDGAINPYTCDLISYKDDNQDNNDLIIPDNIIINNKTYPIINLLNGCINLNKSINTLVIGENITKINKSAIKLRHCNNLIFKGRKIVEIKSNGLNININIDKLVLPNSLFYLGGEFISGRINTLEFEEGSKLLTLECHCFSGFERINNLHLPTTVERIGLDALTKVVNVYFDEGDLAIETCDSSFINPNYYADGEYFGTLTNPYKVCIYAGSDKIHPDTEIVLDVFARKDEKINSVSEPLYSSEFSPICTRLLLKYYNNVDDNQEVVFNLPRELLTKMRNFSNDDYDLLELIHKRDKIFTEYQDCYYMIYKGNPYGILVACKKDLTKACVHKDCISLASGCFMNAFKLQEIIFEGDKLTHIESDIINPFCVLNKLTLPDSLISLGRNNNIAHITKTGVDDSYLNYYHSYHQMTNSKVITPTKKTRLSSRMKNRFINYLDFKNLSLEEYSLLSLANFRHQETGGGALNFFNDYFHCKIQYVKESDNQFICEYHDRCNFRAVLTKEDDDFSYYVSDMNNRYGIASRRPIHLHLINYLYHRKQRLDNANQQLLKNPNLINFVGINLLQCFLSNASSVKQYFDLREEYNQHHFEYLGTKDQSYYVKVDGDVCMIKILPHFSSVSELTEEKMILALMYLKNNIDLLVSDLVYTGNEVSDENCACFSDTIEFDHRTFNEIIRRNMYDCLLVSSLYDIKINEQDVKTYLDLMSYDDIKLRFYLTSLNNKRFGQIWLNFKNYYLEYEYYTNQMIIDNMDVINEGLLAAIIKKRKFNEQELQDIINYNQTRKEFTVILQAIYSYQFFSEDFFFNNAGIIIKSNINLNLNCNDWFLEKNQSNKLKIFLKLNNK